MSTPTGHPDESGDQDPAAGSSAPADDVHSSDEDELTPFEEAERGASDHVPDA